MADNEFKQYVAAYGPLKFLAMAVFTTAGASAPSVGLNRGFRTIARNTTGLFRLTLAHSSRNLICLVTEQSAAALHTHTARVRAVTPSTGVVDIATVLTSGPTDADTTGITLHVAIYEEQK